MKTFFTSDHHFFHNNIIKYANRPFKSLEHMHYQLVGRWNDVVGPDDTVYHLGDMFMTNDTTKIRDILAELNGNICIVFGNHDKNWRSKAIMMGLGLLPDMCEVSVEDSTKQRHKITLCHYPMLRWNKAHYGSIHLHGHSHGGLDEENAKQPLCRLDIGVDSHNYYPISVDQVLGLLAPKIEFFKTGGFFDHHKEI